MKRKRHLIIIIVLIVLIIGLHIAKVIGMNMRMKEYDFVFGVYNNKYNGGEKYLYGYKEGRLYKLDSDYKKDFRNFNRITGTTSIITYFDYNTWNKLYKDMKGSESYGNADYKRWGIPMEYEDVFMNYYNNYRYNPMDKEIFDDMVNELIFKHEADGESIKFSYFFITKNGYYLDVYENEIKVLYKYDESNKSLIKLFELDSNDVIEFFDSK